LEQTVLGYRYSWGKLDGLSLQVQQDLVSQ
jgi:hypothetical protein